MGDGAERTGPEGGRVEAVEAGRPHRSLYWEDFRSGGSYVLGERTVSAADVAAFAAVSGDHNPLHLDDGYARESVFGERVAHGVLGLAAATGLLQQSGLTAGTLVALLAVSWTFRRPIRPSDRVALRVVVSEVRPTSHAGRGVVRLGAVLENQRGEVVQEGDLTLLVRRRPM
jgi:acyl dehydratase